MRGRHVFVRRTCPLRCVRRRVVLQRHPQHHLHLLRRRLYDPLQRLDNSCPVHWWLVPSPNLPDSPLRSRVILLHRRQSLHPLRRRRLPARQRLHVLRRLPLGHVDFFHGFNSCLKLSWYTPQPPLAHVSSKTSAPLGRPPQRASPRARSARMVASLPPLAQRPALSVLPPRTPRPQAPPRPPLAHVPPPPPRANAPAVCSAGSFSSNGLLPCALCPIGSFQPRAQSTSCSPCPASTTTLSPGATALSSCQSPCHLGSFSSNGMEPCTQCPKGSFQNGTHATSCIACPSGQSTAGMGSVSSDACLSTPQSSTILLIHQTCARRGLSRPRLLNPATTARATLSQLRRVLHNAPTAPRLHRLSSRPQPRHRSA